MENNHNKDMPEKTKRKSLSKIERLENLIHKEAKIIQAIKHEQQRLSENKKRIEDLQKEIGGIEFLQLSPTKFLELSKALEWKSIPFTEIFQLLSEGNFEKLREIHSAIKTYIPIDAIDSEGDKDNIFSK